MNHWCESCARKNLCYMVDDRPKCFVPITNTASGTSESYLAKLLRDSHEIAKDEPQTIIGERFPSYITMNNAQVLDGWQTNPRTLTTAVEGEPELVKESTEVVKGLAKDEPLTKCDLCKREGDDICVDCERKKQSGKE